MKTIIVLTLVLQLSAVALAQNSFTFRASCRSSNRRCAQRRAAPEGVFLETRWSKPVPGYVNRTSETSPELVHAAYGSNYARLAETKKKYNPNSVLFINQYINPIRAMAA